MRIKRFNENHKDIDPYGEENWEGDLVSELSMDDFNVDTVSSQTVWHFCCTVKGSDVQYKLSEDDIGYYWLDLLDHGQLPDDVQSFLDENKEEIRDYLLEKR